jgi:enoyl-CoA hydratase/carnithine racemase
VARRRQRLHADVEPPDRLNALTASSYQLLASVLGEAATVHGVAVGIGFTIQLHCDVVLLADNARLRAPFTQLGTAPEAGSSWLRPRAIGAQRAAELILTSRWLTAAEAVEWGLAAQSCPPDALHRRVSEVAHEIAAHSTEATQAAERLLREGRTQAVRTALERERDTASALQERLSSIAW